MNTVVIEHVALNDLPAAWRAQLPVALNARVTVRIEEETESAQASASTNELFFTDDPAFGIWHDREDMADVEAYLRKLRAPRYNQDGSRNADQLNAG